MLEIINNPFDIVLNAVVELYPNTEALIQFNPNLRGSGTRRVRMHNIS
jgi:hypothetical protein